MSENVIQNNEKLTEVAMEDNTTTTNNSDVDLSQTAGGLHVSGSLASLRTATPDSTIGIPLEKAPRPFTRDPRVMYDSEEFDSEGPGPALEKEEERKEAAVPAELDQITATSEEAQSIRTFTVVRHQSSVGCARAGILRDIIKGIAIGLFIVLVIMLAGYSYLDKNCKRSPGNYDCEKGLFVLEHHFVWALARMFPAAFDWN